MRVRFTLGIAAAYALRRFRRDRNGSVAIQFALVGIPFLMMMFAILETALMFFAMQAMETATQDTARLIMTGQAQMGGMNAETFKTSLCTKLSGLMNCTGGVDVDVKSFPNFASVVLNNPVSNGNYNNTTTYSPGSAGNIVVVRTFYQWPVFVTGLGYNIGNLNGNKRLLVATAAFRNEPGPF
jgi:Flp pilus assembly protein TadG